MVQHHNHKAIAEIIRTIKPVSETEPEISSVRSTANNIAIRLANYFAGDNERFDREEFLETCGLEH